MGEWAWVAQADDDFSPACADRRCEDCHAEDCVCACHVDQPEQEPEFLTAAWFDKYEGGDDGV